jgi:AcrR family transcriptional regulator
MVQVAKDHVRQSFVAAAAEAFAEHGYATTTMAAVAERAGSSVGNLYKYFAGKQQLFEAAVPTELVHELTRRTRARIRALGAFKDVRDVPPDAEYHALAGELLDYCLAHRAQVVVLLSRAEGTSFASFAPGFVEKLVQWALDYATLAYPALAPSPELRFVLRHAYASYLRAVAEALRVYPDDEKARAVIGLLTAQHQGGLKHLFETQGAPYVESHQLSQPPLVVKPARARAGDARAPHASSSSSAAAPGKADRASRARRRR